MSKLPDYLGPYRVGRFIRSGNSTQIWEASKPDGGGRFVLKVLNSQHWNNKEEIGFIKHEFEVGQSLSHPNVIKIHEFRRERNFTYLVLELFTNLNIKQVLREQGQNVILVNFQKIVEQCGAGLQHLHEKGWVHCDVKPDNFLLNEEGEVKLIDFSIAQRATRGKFSAIFRRRTQVQGTRSYMSPEQIRNEALDPRADVYSLGCMLFELLSNRVPYTGNSPNDLLNKHLTAGVPSAQVYNDNLTPEMAELVRRMMAKEPEQRPASMQEFLKQFRAVRAFKLAPRLESSADQT